MMILMDICRHRIEDREGVRSSSLVDKRPLEVASVVIAIIDGNLYDEDES